MLRTVLAQTGLALALALALGVPALAADPPPSAAPADAAAAPNAAAPKGWAYDLANELMSPFCPGRTLADCPSPQAQNLRLWLVVQESAGRSEDEVRQELLARYGDVMRPTPKAEGFGLAAYLVPALAFAAGGVLVALFLRRVTGGAESPSTPQVPDPELERIVDEELAG